MIKRLLFKLGLAKSPLTKKQQIKLYMDLVEHQAEEIKALKAANTNTSKKRKPSRKSKTQK